LALENAEAGFKSGEVILNNIYKYKKNISQSKLPSVPKKNVGNYISSQALNLHYFKGSEELEKFDNLIDQNDIIYKYFEHVMTNEEEINLRKTLSNHFVFKDINPEMLNLVLSELIFFTFPKDKIIYEEGDEGNFFYIIASGSVESTAKEKHKKTYGKWECFGELSLLTQRNREETVKCLEKVEVFTIDGDSFKEIQKRINENILKERFNFLNSIAIFESLDKNSKFNVAQKIKLKEFQHGDQIITKGEVGDSLYIIKEGLVSCRIGIQEIRKLGVNDYFGQNAILIDLKRAMDIIALQKTLCYELTRNDLKDALGKDYIDVILYCFFKNSIEKSDLKDIFIESQMQEIFKTFKIKIYHKNEKIYDIKSPDKAKTNNKRMIVVIEGSIYKNDESDELVAEKGGIIGGDLFKDLNKGLPEDLVVNPDCISLESNIVNLAKIMKIDLNQEKPLNILNRIGKLKKLYLFKNLSEKTLELIATKLKKLKFKEDEVIVYENTNGDTFYLISKGRVRITKGGKFIRDIESGNCFGENILLTNDSRRTATVTAIDKVVCYCLSRTEFDFILDDKTIKNYLLKKLALQDTSINLPDLFYIKFLGKGKFGSVSLVHNKKNIYGIKAISRKSVDKQKILAKYFVNERRVMLSLDHPFVVKMVKSMKNQYYCFLLMEYVNGKNLDEHLSTRAYKKNLYETQFYIGSMLLMLDYLQKKFIAHRDIKPSNIMIDNNGYLKMIDFGTAKVLTDYTSTVIGTPHYIAPEILQGKGYSLSCDFWSVGITLYEIFYGIYPFGNYANEVIEIYKEILHKEFIFPSDNVKYQHVNSLITDLLTKKVNQRICNVSILKKRPFFNEFDFDQLNDFKLNPPYSPPFVDLSQYLQNTDTPYEDIVAQDNYVGSKKDKEDYCPAGYDRHWADEF
jgi:cGMP-dependent protein kinase